MIESPVERLLQANPHTEVWWDSSPLVYPQWETRMLEEAPPERREALRDQLRRLFNPDDPAQSVFRGCTTNPPLSLKAVQADPATWNAWIDDLIRSHPELDEDALFWRTYKEVVRRGAEKFLPMYEASEGRYGWISGQLDPRKAGDLSAMIAAAEELHALAPNVMIKVPATMQGIEALEVLTSKAISTNTTVCFTVSQTLEAARAVYRGTLAARKNSVDLGRWRSVITLMIGRLTEREALDAQARRAGIALSEVDKRWLGLAVFKRGVRMLRDNGWPSKMLACSMREGPRVAGRTRFWDVEKLSGGDIVYTMPPYVLEPLFRLDHDLVFRPDAIDEGVPEEILDKLLRIPYGLQAYHPNGLSLEQFNDHPSTLDTIEAFSRGTRGLQDYVVLRRAAINGNMSK